jgi:UDP-N-acetylmuramoyl-L-alanyl-D-glutamate--2,6-diaminopimelate ligase
MGTVGKQYSWLEKTLRFIERYIPKKLYRSLQPLYHYLLTLTGAIIYRFPGRKLIVIAVTGTKGKTSVAELLDAIFEKAGYTTALVSTLRFKIANTSERNMYKMTLRGRFFLQRFLRKAVTAGCTHVVVEITSEAAVQFRHKFISLNGLIFTNISPEHIESHGSFEKYVDAKLLIAKELNASTKKNTVMVTNSDDALGYRFLETAPSATPVTFSLNEVSCESAGKGLIISYTGMEMHSLLEGEFNCMNILAALKCAESLGVPLKTIKTGIESVSVIKGRVEHINEGQSFEVIVDYAHTPDSLSKLYQTFADNTKICVLGNTGGGRDSWKRPEMGRIADAHCDTVILTNEDPYDEDPKKILTAMAMGMKRKPIIVMDRREAIKEALRTGSQKENAVVLITGKGTDPYIMGARGTKEPWSDERVVREELISLNKQRA